MYGPTTPTLFPRRGEPALYTVRVELSHTSPPVWRLLELAYDLYLDEVHDILQTAFGWDNSHLHNFGKGGKRFYDRKTTYFLSPYDVDEGERGIAEENVRLDEVLERKGDRLFYLYDFGDDWELALTLRDTAPLTADTPRARCADGRRASPVDDSGGPYQYEFWEAVNDPEHPHHTEAVTEYRAAYGEDDDPTHWAPKPFDRDKVDKRLRRLFPETGPAERELSSAGEERGTPLLPGPVADLLIDASYQGPEAEELLAAMVDRAGLTEPAQVDEAAARRMTAPYAWLLEHAGAEGLPLTQMGYLKPADVEASADVLGLRGDWVGKLNREDQTVPVRVFRETAQRMKLLRRYRGKLMRTPAGRKVDGDPVALWTQLAERMPADEDRTGYDQGGLLLLLAVAGGDDVLAATGRAMAALGWRNHTTPDGVPSPGEVFGLVRDSHTVLTFLGALTERGMDARPTPQGRLFARAALQNWPREG
ncbi:plasmid pRiA4b ORF-3 family protein [Nocardiopsis synnemataformans]|uniref:plasmid pRiA4b ORF-3 family protein n=1 Tax=Nocardiopsis synnemataformans TaxID=61305 RepID=UPI003EBDA0E3